MNEQFTNKSKQIKVHLLREELQHSSTLTTDYPVTDKFVCLLSIVYILQYTTQVWKIRKK